VFIPELVIQIVDSSVTSLLQK